MKQGFVWDVEQRDLDLEEVRDMLLLTRGEQEKDISVTACEGAPRKKSTFLIFGCLHSIDASWN